MSPRGQVRQGWLDEAHEEMRQDQADPTEQLDIPREIMGVTRFVRIEGDARARFEHAKGVLSKIFHKALAISMIEMSHGNDEGYEYTSLEPAIQISGAPGLYVLNREHEFWKTGPGSTALIPYALTMRTVDGPAVAKLLPYSDDDYELKHCPEILLRFFAEFQAVADCVDEMAAADPDGDLAAGQVISVLPEGLKIAPSMPMAMAP